MNHTILVFFFLIIVCASFIVINDMELGPVTCVLFLLAGLYAFSDYITPVVVYSSRRLYLSAALLRAPPLPR